MPSNRFFLVFRNQAGVMHEEELDFNALLHDVAFSAVCSGQLPNDGRWEPVDAEPEWAEGRLEAVTVSVAGISRRYDRGVFKARAKEVLLTRGLLGDMESDDRPPMSWDVEVRKPTTEARRDRRCASVRHHAYPLVQRGATEPGTRRGADEDTGPSISVSARLLAELREASAASLDRERADFLVGHLVQEQLHGPIAVVFLDRIPANPESDGSLVRFPFSPRTFQDAQRELARGGSDRVILGWHHNHPPPCGRDCLMKIPACDTENVLFSLDDRVVHRSAFSRPYMVALVSGKGKGRRADDPLMRAYGWRRGIICEKEWSVF
jgi:hypothetical protein